MPKEIVYVLKSSNCRFVKIGKTTKTVQSRITGLNKDKTYGPHGPWHFADAIEVLDSTLVETGLHKRFAAKRCKSIPRAKELFDISLSDARRALSDISPELKPLGGAAIKLFRTEDVKNYVYEIMRISGLFGCLDLQGAWTLVPYPSTNRNQRSFTINIGAHEVAFSALIDPKKDDRLQHYIIMDELAADSIALNELLDQNDGFLGRAPYKFARDRAVTVGISGDFSIAHKMIELPVVRRAIIAYWQDYLLDLQYRGKSSSFARHHSYEAVAALNDFHQARRGFLFDDQPGK